MRIPRILSAMLAVLTITAVGATAQPAPDDHTVLILGSSVGFADPSLEATRAMAQGYTVVVDSDVAWLARTTADFATFQAIILGDKECDFGNYTAAETNRVVWSAAITGNIVVVGTDPTYHSSFGPGGAQGGDQVVDSAIAFATAEDGKTGAYISLSCYFHGTPPNTPVLALDQFGMFTVTGVGCYNDAHIVASHPALAGLTDASLSNWTCSVHEAFDSHPSDFLPLVIAEGIGCPSPPGSGQNFGDGTCGTPYVLARGEELVPAACGDGTLNPEIGEQCDDGNTANGDGCSAQCTIEIPACGDGNLDPGEQCDDGNTTNGDGCSANCTIENAPPVCTDATATIGSIWPPNHKMVSVGITGVTDPDSDPVTITITSIMQDEPTNTVGDGNTSCDAQGVGGPAAQVRAERSGSNKVPGNGRFYHIFFTADDGAGGSCEGSVAVAVPHDQSHTPVDGGPLYNSCAP